MAFRCNPRRGRDRTGSKTGAGDWVFGVGVERERKTRLEGGGGGGDEEREKRWRMITLCYSPVLTVFHHLGYFCGGCCPESLTSRISVAKNNSCDC
mmetsp:Transcript_15827/g.38532  ORF Transcript_15827/g.38532 Transcript_15827/m.38532 type:complete len:96 (-) Transcript_15827:107-394(-)